MSTRGHRKTLAERLGRHELALGAALLLGLATLTWLALISTNGIPLLPSYELNATLPPDAPQLRPGADVRLRGRASGLVKSVTRRPDGSQRIRFSVRGGNVGDDATLAVRLKSPAGGRYLAVEPGDYERHPLADGATIPTRRITFTEDLPAVVDGLGRAAARNAARSIRLLGAGVDGRGERLNRDLVDLDKTLARVTGLLGAASRRDDLPALVRSTGVTMRGLAGERADDAAGLVTGAGRLAQTLADPRSRLDATLRVLPAAEEQILATLPQADPVLDRLAVASRRLTPSLRALRAALPSVNRLLTRGPLLRGELAALSSVARPALRALGPVLRRSGPVAVLLGRTLGPLGSITGFLARYPKELEAGAASTYFAYLYGPDAGIAKGYTVAPIMLILTCASGTNPRPQPGDYLTDKLEKPCR